MGFRQRLSAWLGRLVPRRPLGRRGEAAAARFLRRRGLRIVARSNRLKPGELDIVALDGDVLVFVEVKTRRSGDFGHPAEAVTPAKQRRLSRLAVTFMKRHGLLDRKARFDVVAVTWPEGKWFPEIEHFPDAFEAAGQWEFYS